METVYEHSFNQIMRKFIVLKEKVEGEYELLFVSLRGSLIRIHLTKFDTNKYDASVLQSISGQS
jgi:hypothetical protein